MANTITKLASYTVGASTTATITFSSIPQTYQDLYVVLSLRSDGVQVNAMAGNLYFNTQTSSYTNTVLRNNTNSVSSFRSGALSGAYSYMNGGGTTAGIWSTASHYITNYTSTTLYKQILSESATEGLANFDSHNFINSALFNSTAAVTSLSINYTNLAQYSTATLYGIKNT